MRFLIDTNVLIRFRDVQDTDRSACVEVLDRRRFPMCPVVLCTQNLIEYWAVATRPISANGLGRSPLQASLDLTDFATFPRLEEPPDIYLYWKRLVEKFNVSGRPAHDARLIALMDAHGISGLITLNKRDFARYPHITCQTPQEWIAGNPKQAAP